MKGFIEVETYDGERACVAVDKIVAIREGEIDEDMQIRKQVMEKMGKDTSDLEVRVCPFIWMNDNVKIKVFNLSYKELLKRIKSASND